MISYNIYRSSAEGSHTQIKPRTLVPISRRNEGLSLLDAKWANRFGRDMLETFMSSRTENNGVGHHSKTPTLKKREIDELEKEVAELKGRLSKLLGITGNLLKRLPQREAE